MDCKGCQHNLWGHKQWNPSCEATLLHQKSGLPKGVASRQGKKSIHLCLDLQCQVALPEGVGLLLGWPSKRGSTVVILPACTVVTMNSPCIRMDVTLWSQKLSYASRSHYIITELNSPYNVLFMPQHRTWISKRDIFVIWIFIVSW